MGSFTEVVLSVDFRADIPAHVLAAFSALADRASLPQDAPALPAPVEEAWPEWAPDWREVGYADGEGDPFEAEPWRHEWAGWLDHSMSVQTTPHARLAWSQRRRWNLDVRSSFKCGPDTVSEFLAWLAPFVEDWDEPLTRRLVGHAHYEYAPRPHLFWVRAGRWELEDLNPDDDW